MSCQCHAMPFRAMACHAMPCHAMPYHAMICHAMAWHVMPCHAMPCHAMLCHVSRFEPYLNDLHFDIGQGGVKQTNLSDAELLMAHRRRRWPSINPIVVQRRRRWPSINPIVVQHIVFKTDFARITNLARVVPHILL